MRHWEIPRKCRLACERDTYTDTCIVGLAFWYVWISLDLQPNQYIPCSQRVKVDDEKERMCLLTLTFSTLVKVSFLFRFSALSVDTCYWFPNKVNQLGPWLPPSHPSLSHSPHTPQGHSLLLKPKLVHPHFPLRLRCHLEPTPHQSSHLDIAIGHWQSRALPLGPPHHRMEREWWLWLPLNVVSVCGEARWWSLCMSWAWRQQLPCSSWRTPRRD